MTRQKKSVAEKVGMSPGSLIFVGEKKTEQTLVTLMDYAESYCDYLSEVDNVDQLSKILDKKSVSWINVYGLHDMEIIESFGKQFSIHPLLLEDVINTHQRPKIEITEEHVFFVFKMVWFDEEAIELTTEQISVVMNDSYVLCFQERKGDVFSPLRKRIRDESSRLRKRGTDYLTYAILDVVIDNYFLILEKLGDEIEALEEEIIDEPGSETVGKINDLRRTLIQLRKAIWPLREVVSAMMREDTPHFRQDTLPFIRDLYDHTIQVIDSVETYREMVGSLLDMYMSFVSHGMNEVMKVLTIIATIFIPLTFVAGIYGMNFERMPELHWSFGYPFVWVVMLVITLGMVLFFRRKKWM